MSGWVTIKKGLLEQKTTLVYWFMKMVDQEILLWKLVKCSQALIKYLTKNF